jgi:hypothetical protein
MSIWSSAITLAADQPLGEPYVDYMDEDERYYVDLTTLDQATRGGWLDLADTGFDIPLMRFSIRGENDTGPDVWLDPAQVAALRDAMTRWLDRKPW